MNGGAAAAKGLMQRRTSSSSLASQTPPPKPQAMDPSKHLRIPSLSSSFLLHPAQLPPSSLKPPLFSPRRLGVLCTALLLFLCFSFYAFSLSRGVQFSVRFQKARNKGYAVIIDAGSSGSRLHVFQYVNEGLIPVVGLMGREEWSLKTKPGLSAYAANPSEAGESLTELLEFARGKVQERERASTRLYLMATAGLRRLEVETQEAILESCRLQLRASGFQFQDEWASVITGTDEGVFAWVAANYALGTLGRKPQDTTGIIELGGASAQVTFVPELPPPPEYLHTLELGGMPYMLYTHSFLHFGQEAAWDALVHLLLSGSVQPSFPSVDEGMFVNPCTPRGFVINSEDLAKYSATILDANHFKTSILSAGNFSECRSAALNLLQKGQEECLYQRCAVGSTFVPELRGKFFATENFFYTSQFFGLVPKASLADIQAAGQHFCEEEWAILQERHKGIEREDLSKYCFSSAYILALLNDSLGIGMHDERVWFTNQVGKISLDWALGALIVRMEENSTEESSVWMAEDDYKTVLSILAFSVLIGLTIFVFARWRRPHIKTIYDLEKGRYITTIARSLK